MKIDCPTWITKGSPTPYESPYERLMICDKCGTAVWTAYSIPNVQYCMGHGRMRDATKDEYAAGKAAITKVIG